ncbi:hypothetical protein [Streptomyces misionensis]|uniref:hypothetical protein n=1 Tax=Streptomyces misionensis TaxID=67331 RepID=UPI00396B86BA
MTDDDLRAQHDTAIRGLDSVLNVEAGLAEVLDWERTGRIRCADCGAMVRTQTLETLPAHRCTERQRARRAVGRDGEK